MTLRPSTILIVSENAPARRALAEQLAQEEAFRILQAATWEEGVSIIRQKECDLVLLDVNGPDGDLQDTCASLQKEGIHMPVILLTSRGTAHALITDSTTCETITKPFRLDLLLERIRRALEQPGNRTGGYRIGPYDFQPQAKVLVDGEDSRIPLTDREVAILEYLCCAGNRAVSREELLQKVWGYRADVTTHTVETHIYRLRRKLQARPGQTQLLLTCDGGYRLLCERTQQGE